MDFPTLIRASFALMLTLGLIGLAAVGLRRYGPDAMARLTIQRKDRRLKLVETLILDPARRVVIVSCDGHERLILTLALAVVVAVALKVVGALLIAAMLIIPAAAARALARTPEGMAAMAVAFGAAASLLGLQLSIWQDTPAGPSIVVAAAGLFAVSAVLGRMVRA